MPRTDVGLPFPAGFLPRGYPLFLALLCSLLPGAPAAAQDARSRWEWAGVPALNYDADEGFGYGAALELYRYGGPEARPYRFTLQPTLFLTTGGRRDLTLFVDAPHLLPGSWRLDAFVGSERQVASPYYGVGNATRPDPSREEDEENPDYYRFGRVRRQAVLNLQHPLGRLPLRALAGAGAVHTRVDPTPHDRGSTLLAEELSGGTQAQVGNFVRGGLVWDSRDRETGATRGVWSELLVQRVDRRLGSDADYTRWTAADRRYLPLVGERLVLANRVVIQQVLGDAPVYDLHLLQSSYKQQEGLGGAKTIRGLPKNRLVGKGLLLWNAELRWRAAEFQLLGKPSHLVLSGFVDSGRVWEERVRAEELGSDLHHGAGGGVRLGMGENFVVALDVGHSAEATAPFYIGLGYLF